MRTKPVASLTASLIRAAKPSSLVAMNDASGLTDASDPSASAAFQNAAPSLPRLQQEMIEERFLRSQNSLQNPTAEDMQTVMAALQRSQDMAMALAVEVAKTKSKLRASETENENLKSENKDLKAKSLTDNLTQLKNRAGLEAAFAAEQSRIERGESTGAVVLMMDLNGFKLANDTYGHNAGDECLKKVAEVLKQSIRPTDIAVRLGGDEFVVVLTNTTLMKAAQHIRQIHENLNSAHIVYDGHTIPIKSSMGTAEFNGEKPFEDVMHIADEGMYRSKRALKAGRDQQAAPRI
jgi:diguanylate cyclase (GGDEF)-like protein